MHGHLSRFREALSRSEFVCDLLQIGLNKFTRKNSDSVYSNICQLLKSSQLYDFLDMVDTLILLQVPGISEQSVCAPVDQLKSWQEAEAQTQSKEAAHLEALLF